MCNIPKEVYDQLPGIWCSVDKESKYVYLNSAYARLVGLDPENRDSLLGKTVADIPCKASECAELFWQEDDLVKATKDEVQVINVVRLADDNWKIIHLGKKPIINQETQEICSIMFHINDLTNCPVASSIESLMFNGKLSAETVNNEVQLYTKLPIDVTIKEKESECLFFLVRGFSYKQIAKFRGVSPNTIIDQVERLKTKFNCLNKSELVAKANSLGYASYVPQHLLNKQLSLILDSK